MQQLSSNYFSNNPINTSGNSDLTNQVQGPNKNPLLIGGLISAGIAAITEIATTIYNNKKADDRADENMDFQREQFDYQQYLNENQQQIQASDAAKAGINPLAMHGNSLSSTSFSGSSSQRQQMDLSSLTGLLSPLLQYKLGKEQLSQDKYLANQDRDLSREQKQLDLQMQKEELQEMKQKRISDQISQFANNLTSLKTALISSNASKYGADKSSSASRYSADKSLEGTKYSVDNSWGKEEEIAKQEFLAALAANQDERQANLDYANLLKTYAETNLTDTQRKGLAHDIIKSMAMNLRTNDTDPGLYGQIMQSFRDILSITDQRRLAQIYNSLNSIKNAPPKRAQLRPRINFRKNNGR